MKIKATWILERTYEPNPAHYPDGATEEEILAIDKDAAEDDPEMFFSDPTTNTITIEEVETLKG